MYFARVLLFEFTRLTISLKDLSLKTFRILSPERIRKVRLKQKDRCLKMPLIKGHLEFNCIRLRDHPLKFFLLFDPGNIEKNNRRQL
jgi:hypothetical protein